MRLAEAPSTLGPLAPLFHWRIAIVVGLLVAVCVTAAFVGVPMWRLTDVAGALERTAHALVLDRSSFSGKDRSRWFVIFRVGTHVETVDTTDLDSWARSNTGDTLPVSYRVGKSGALYIDDWAPVDHPATR